MGKLILICISVIIFAYNLFSWNLQNNRLPANVENTNLQLNCKPIPTDKFNIDLFIDEIKSRGTVKTVEDALCLIPKDIRSNYVLVHSSRSAQGSRPEAPRAILYKSKERNGTHELEYAISFNGNAGDTNFNNIEVVKGNRKAEGAEQHFEYIDIEFNESGKGNPHVSESNPQQCMMCHGVMTNRARAIWDAKGFTPTVYGASTFGGSIGEEKHIDEFNKFIDSASSHSRYRFLENLDHLKVENKRIKNQETVNSIFAEALGTTNNRRISQLIRETPDYELYKYAILGSLLFCPQITTFVPERLHSDHRSLDMVDPAFRNLRNEQSILAGYKKYADQFEANNSFSSMSAVNSNIQSNGEINMDPQLLPYFHDIEAKAVQWVTTAGMPIVNLRWLIEGRGQNMEEWAMDVPLSGNFGFYRLINARYVENSSVGDQNLDSIRIAQFLIESDSHLRLAFANSGIGGGIGNVMKMFRNGNEKTPLFQPNNMKKLCEALKAKSLQKMRWTKPRSNSRDGSKSKASQ